jgi:hypothetical protein
MLDSFAIGIRPKLTLQFWSGFSFVLKSGWKACSGSSCRLCNGITQTAERCSRRDFAIASPELGLSLR